MTIQESDHQDLAPPFGMRFLTRPESREPQLSGGYSEALQLNVTAESNPWHTLASGDTQTETDTGDGTHGGSDSGTDLY